LATVVGSIDRFTRACYQRIPALSNLSDPSAEQSVKITSTKDSLECTREPPGAQMFYCVGSKLARSDDVKYGRKFSKNAKTQL